MAAHEAAVRCAKTYDVVIVGGGPAGLNVLSALHNREGALTDKEQSEMYLRRKKGQTTFKAKRTLACCVVDPSGAFLHEWRGRFEALDIGKLRSPVTAQPDFFSANALAEYAWSKGRDGELHALDLSTTCLRHLTELNAGLFRLPGSQIFADFCDDLTTSLPHDFERGEATRVAKRGDGTYAVHVAGGRTLAATSVVLALGSASTPRVPEAFGNAGRRPSTRVCHTADWARLKGLDFAGETLLVVGGGLSAAQAALRAERRGARRVVLCSRRPMVCQHYDLGLEWMNPRTTKKGNARGKLFEFKGLPLEARMAWIRSARGGATVPPGYLAQLDKAARRGRLERRVGEVATAEEDDDDEGGALRVTFRGNSTTAPLVADRVVLATGTRLDVASVPLLAGLAKDLDLPVVAGLPALDDTLAWGGDERLFVVGALAALQVGPDAANLAGARRAADICAANLGCHDALVEKGNVLANIFDVFGADDDDSSDDDDDDDDDDQGDDVPRDPDDSSSNDDGDQGDARSRTSSNHSATSTRSFE